MHSVCQHTYGARLAQQKPGGDDEGSRASRESRLAKSGPRLGALPAGGSALPPSHPIDTPTTSWIADNWTGPNWRVPFSTSGADFKGPPAGARPEEASNYVLAKVGQRRPCGCSTLTQSGSLSPPPQGQHAARTGSAAWGVGTRPQVMHGVPRRGLCVSARRSRGSSAQGWLRWSTVTSAATAPLRHACFEGSGRK